MANELMRTVDTLWGSFRIIINRGYYLEKSNQSAVWFSRRIHSCAVDPVKCAALQQKRLVCKEISHWPLAAVDGVIGCKLQWFRGKNDCGVLSQSDLSTVRTRLYTFVVGLSFSAQIGNKVCALFFSRLCPVAEGGVW